MKGEKAERACGRALCHSGLSNRSRRPGQKEGERKRRPLFNLGAGTGEQRILQVGVALTPEGKANVETNGKEKLPCGVIARGCTKSYLSAATVQITAHPRAKNKEWSHKTGGKDKEEVEGKKREG